MTVKELRESTEYAKSMQKIKSYPKGFKFSLKYGEIPKAKGNALKIIMKDAIDSGLLESVSIGLDIHGEFVEEEYRRL